jgi:hypothetical protein
MVECNAATGIGVAGHRAGNVQQAFEMTLGRFMAGGDHGQHVGQRPDLNALVVKGRRLDPGVLAVVLKRGVMGVGLAVVGMARRVATLILVPGVFDALLDPVAEIGVLIAGDRLELATSPLGI